MKTLHRDNIQQQPPEAEPTVSASDIEQMIDRSLAYVMASRPDRTPAPRPMRHYVAGVIVTANLLSLTAVFWLSLAGQLESRQVIYGAVVFLLMALVGGVIGNSE